MQIKHIMNILNFEPIFGLFYDEKIFPLFEL